MPVFSIGHSTLPLDQFIEILRAYRVELVVDVRSIPRSRHNPQFNEADLKLDLEQQGIGYFHLKELGGLRHTTKASINTAWRNSSFRGFADYMQTGEFETGIEQLLKLSGEKPTVIMCAEAVPWRCHRSLIGDALLVRGIEVTDIYSATSSKPHSLPPWAKVDGLAVTYPGTPPEA